MKARSWILGLAIVASLLVATDYLFLHILFPLKKAELMEDLNRGVEEHLRDVPPDSFIPIPGEEEPAEKPPDESSAKPRADRFGEAVAACFGPAATLAQEPSELVRRLSATGVAGRQVPLENWHIARPDGQEQRIMLVDSDRENAHDLKEIRLFDVDEEGLPIPKPLDPEIALNPSDEMIRGLLASGDIRFHQRHEVLRFANGSSAEVEWVNGGVRDLQVFLADRTLACRGRECRCL